MISVDLGNGDEVGVVTAWRWPDPFDLVSVEDLRAVQKTVQGGNWRDSIQSKNWVGVAVAQVLRLDHTSKRDRARINAMLKIWKANGMFVVVDRKDDHGEMRPFVEVGEAA